MNDLEQRSEELGFDTGLWLKYFRNMYKSFQVTEKIIEEEAHSLHIERLIMEEMESRRRLA